MITLIWVLVSTFGVSIPTAAYPTEYECLKHAAVMKYEADSDHQYKCFPVILYSRIAND